LDYYLVALGGLALIAFTAQFSQPLSATRGLYAVGLLGGIGYAWTFNHYGLNSPPLAAIKSGKTFR